MPNYQAALAIEQCINSTMIDVLHDRFNPVTPTASSSFQLQASL
jgi:hypothetical protein